MTYPVDTNCKVNQVNDIHQTIRISSQIDDVLHVIIVLSNPCGFKKRVLLAREFIMRVQREPGVILYIVELSYNGKFEITDKHNERHLQLTTPIPLWHKENMINLGVQRLLPHDWKCFAWIDADIEFENTHWVTDTLKILGGSKDIVQLWSHCDDMNARGETMKIFQSFGYQYCKGRQFLQGVNFWHPGYAWAMTRKAYEQIGGLYELSILGSGDFNMAMSILGFESLNKNTSRGYKKSLEEFTCRCTLRLGYVPGVIRHNYHGSKKNRGYHNRWKILVKYAYDPNIHIKKDSQGVLIPTDEFPNDMVHDVQMYFKERNEDDV